MPSRDRRAAGRRRAWGRGPIILRFEPLEGRQLLTIVAGGSGLGSSASSLLSGAGLTTGTTATASATATTSATATATPTTAAVSTSTTATATATVTGLPDLVATQDTAPSNLDWDESFALGGTVTNQGTGATSAAFNVDVYASPDTKVVAGAVKIGTVTVPAGLGAGQSYHFEQTFTTPATPLKNLGGQTSYYILLAVDTTNTVPESNEANNANLGLQGTDAAMVTITPRLPSKLAADGLVVTPNGGEWGGTLHVQATVRNDGQGDAPPTNARIILAPLGQDPFGPNGYTVGAVPMPTILAGQTSTATQDITLPKEPPTALANVSAFSVTLVVDDGQQADPVITPVTWQGQGIDWARLDLTPKAATATTANLPDLKVDSVQNPAWVAWGQSFTVKTTVENHGKSDAGPFKVRFYLVQGDGANAPTLALGDASVSSLTAGGSQEVSQTVKLPAVVPAGLDGTITTGRIVAQANYDHALDEASLDDNIVQSAPIGLKVVGTDGTSTPVVITPANTKTTPAPTGQTTSTSTTTTSTTTTGSTTGQTSNSGTATTTRGQAQANARAAMLERLAARRQMLQVRIEYLRSLRQSHQATTPRAAHLPNSAHLRIYNGSTPRPIVRIARQGPNRIA